MIFNYRTHKDIPLETCTGADNAPLPNMLVAYTVTLIPPVARHDNGTSSTWLQVSITQDRSAAEMVIESHTIPDIDSKYTIV